MRLKSRRRQWLNCISLEEFTHLALMSDGHCAITGIPFSREDRKHAPFAISVDRIESVKGYCSGNVRFVLLAVNLGMSHWGDEAFRQIARALVGRELIGMGGNSGHTIKTSTGENTL